MAEGDSTLKRQRSSLSEHEADGDSRPSKKPTMYTGGPSPITPSASASSSAAGADDIDTEQAGKEDMSSEVLDALEVELGCACCAGLLWRPTILQPCNHTFCASCVVSWVKNGGTACPTCRSPPDSIHQARFIQGVIDLLVRFRPEAERSAKEREQADELWTPGQHLPLPPARPRQQSPQPLALNLARPCPHCARNNGLGYTCPVPIPDPLVVGRDQAWDFEARGAPAGHGFCAGCDELYAVGAPGAMSCSFCRSRYCGYSVAQTCVIPRVGAPQMPRNMDTVAKLLECDELYEAFSHNSIEVDLLIDYLHTRAGGLNTVLRNILEFVRSQPEGLAALSFLGVEGGEPDGERPMEREDDLSDHGSDSDDDDDDGEGGENPSVAEGNPAHGVGAAVNEAGTQDNGMRTLPPFRPVVIDPAPPAPTEPLPPAPEHAHPSLDDIDSDAGSDMDVDDSFVVPPAGSPGSAARFPVFRQLEAQAMPLRAAYNLAAVAAEAAPNATPAGAVPAGAVPSSAERPTYSRICRDCSESVFIWGIYDWWVRERSLVDTAVPNDVKLKTDCVDGRRCELQAGVSHAKEFNHICEPAHRPPTPEPAELEVALPETHTPTAPPTVPYVHYHPVPSSDPAEQIIEEMLMPGSLALPILQAQGDINMDDEAEVERQMQQYLNLDVGVAAGV